MTCVFYAIMHVNKFEICNAISCFSCMSMSSITYAHRIHTETFVCCYVFFLFASCFCFVPESNPVTHKWQFSSCLLLLFVLLCIWSCLAGSYSKNCRTLLGKN